MFKIFSSKDEGKVKLTKDRYFPNLRGNECGINSLANLIYYKNKDFETAEKIFLESRNHPLVGYDGTTDITSLPIILEELSCDKYSGLLHLSPNFDFNPNNFNNCDLKGRSLESLKEAIEKSKRKGLFIPSGKINVQPPYLLSFNNLNDKSVGHVLVNAGEYFINNGKIENSIPKKLKLVGLLQVFKKR
jgi:hypothetical protein